MICCRIHQEGDGWTSGEQKVNRSTRLRAVWS